MKQMSEENDVSQNTDEPAQWVTLVRFDQDGAWGYIKFPSFQSTINSPLVGHEMVIYTNRAHFISNARLDEYHEELKALPAAPDGTDESWPVVRKGALFDHLLSLAWTPAEAARNFGQKDTTIMAKTSTKTAAKTAAKTTTKAAAKTAAKVGRGTKKDAVANGSDEKKKPGRGPGSGEYIRELILAGDSTEQILTKVKARFPDSKAGPSDVSWNRGKLRKDGHDIPRANAAAAE